MGSITSVKAAIGYRVAPAITTSCGTCTHSERKGAELRCEAERMFVQPFAVCNKHQAAPKVAIGPLDIT